MQISNEGILVILFVGLVAGWLAGKIVRGTGFGIIGDILVGIAGALVASFLFPKLGIRAQAKWRPAGGLGAASGVLLDVHGEIGRVSMSVILVPFPGSPKPEPAAGLAPASN